jgi:hypothetical protein
VANQDRTPGLRGLLPRDKSRFIPTLESYVPARAAVALPPVPMSVDVDRASRVSDWPMYCNGPDPENALVCPGSPQGCGDCFWAAAAHQILGWTTYAGDTPVTIPPGSVIHGYSSTGYNPQTGENDNGTEPVSGLEYLRTTGLVDAAGRAHKVAAYAAFGNPANELLLGQVLNTFGSVLVAVNITQAQEDQFSDGQPWTYQAGSPQLGGHMICLQRRATGTDILKYVTWGALWPANKAFQLNQAADAYAVVTQDWIDAKGTTVEGLDLQQLLADMPAVG